MTSPSLPRALTASVLVLSLVATGPARAVPQGVAPPYLPPIALQDIGAPRACPVILVAMGQSNRAGYDDNGAKTILPGVFVTNAVAGASNTTPANPTTLVQAVFGAAPLNLGNKSGAGVVPAVTGGVTTAAAAYNNSEVQFGNLLAASGYARPVQSPTDPSVNAAVVIVANWFPGQSISNWVGTTPGSFDQTAQYWQHLLAALAVVQSKYPGCPISEVDWDQGEADSWTTATGYNTAATYGQGLATLIAALKGLTVNGQAMWNADPSKARPSTITLQELATWADNYAANARNDAIDTYRGGVKDPAVDVIPVDGLVESLENPGPHFDGPSLTTIGARLFAAYQHNRAGGVFADRANVMTQAGAADTYPNAIAGPAAATATASGNAGGTTLTLSGVSGTILPGAALYDPSMTGIGVVLAYGTSGTTGTGGAGTYALSKALNATLSSAPVKFGLALGMQDVRSGAEVLANGGPILLPNFSELAGRPVEVEVFGVTASIVDVSQLGGTSLYNEVTGGQAGTVSINANERWRFKVVNGVWHAWLDWPLRGRSEALTFGQYTAGNPQTIGSKEFDSAHLTSGNAITVAPAQGAVYLFREVAAGAGSTIALASANEGAGARVIEPDGTVRDTGSTGANGYPIQPGATVLVEVDGGFNLVVLRDSSRVDGALKPYTVAGLPACNAAAKGRLVMVTDAMLPSYNGSLTGGGSVVVPAFCNGSGWTAH